MEGVVRGDDVWDCENFENWVMAGMYAWIQTDIRKNTMRGILLKCADILKDKEPT